MEYIAQAVALKYIIIGRLQDKLDLPAYSSLAFLNVQLMDFANSGEEPFSHLLNFYSFVVSSHNKWLRILLVVSNHHVDLPSYFCQLSKFVNRHDRGLLYIWPKRLAIKKCSYKLEM